MFVSSSSSKILFITAYHEIGIEVKYKLPFFFLGGGGKIIFFFFSFSYLGTPMNSNSDDQYDMQNTKKSL